MRLSLVPSALSIAVPLSVPFQVTVPVKVTSEIALPPVKAAMDRAA